MEKRDPTKDAFFSDMGNIEEEIASEAYELVRHALSLIETQFYDDAIEILRQAIGLYSQISKLAEIEALNRKIDEVYLIKEKTFREYELETGIEIDATPEGDLLAQDDEESYKEADSLIVKAIELVKKKQFNDALDIYDDVIKILTNLRKTSEIEKINDLIEDCYNRKADFLRKQKTPPSEKKITKQQEPERELSELEVKAKKIRAFEDAKRNENEKSNQAYEKIGEATELKKLRQFDRSLTLLKESVVLFKEINWINEVKKIESMIEQVEREKKRFLLEKQQIKERELRDLNKTKKQKGKLIERANVEEQIKIQAKAEKVKKLAKERQEETNFQNEITEAVNYAERTAREYDLSLKKAVKKGVIDVECVYPSVIKIYEQVKQKVTEKGWKDQVAIYDNQIRHYHDLLEKDTKLRAIESQKIQKQKEFDDSLKIKEDVLGSRVGNDQLAQLKEQRNVETEVKEFKKRIEKSVKTAEKMAREYNSAFKKAVKSGNLNFDSKYPEILKIFAEAREKVLAKGWNEDAVIYSSHIKKYTELFDKEKQVRELETKKDEEKKIYKEFQKSQGDSFDAEKLKHVEAQKMKGHDEQNFREEIEILVNQAEKMAREYDVSLKKALKKGKVIGESPFEKIIEIYNLLRDKLISKGWKEQASIYVNQIKIYQEKWENDKKLRELEHQKLVKQKEYEDPYKIKAEEGISVGKPQEIESKQQKETEEKRFQDEIAELVNTAEKMARDYDLSLKKALKEGKLIGESPFEKIIEIYNLLRDKIISIGWNDQALIYTNQIKIYQEKWENDKKLRELELQKVYKQREFKDSLKNKAEEGITSEKSQKLESKQQKEIEEKHFQDEIAELVNTAEKMARDYDLSLKKALKEGKLIGESPFDNIIGIYSRIKDKIISKGWNDQALIYTNQIKIYQEKWEKDKKLRELELQKVYKQREFKDSLKIKAEEGITSEKSQKLESKQQKEIEEKHFQDEIAELVNEAEKMVREYEINMKKALKESKLIEESPYLEVIEIYITIRRKMLEKGWIEQGLIYTNQIKIYQEKLENDKKLREIERNKILKREEFENAQKMLKPEREFGVDIEKLKKLEELSKIESKEEKFEREIDEVIENAEKKAREYELAIKRRQFEKKCPYLEIVETYKNVRESVYARGWKDEAEIYGNQILLYQEKFEKDKHLREIEAEKIEKQVEFKEALKTTKEVKTLRLQELEELSSQDKETAELTKKAMDLIGEAEKVVRSYELSLKKDILIYKSPYEQAILDYENARKLFQKIGWIEEARKLRGTISFYKDKKINDDNLRAHEQQKLEVSKQTVPIVAKKEVFANEQRIIEFEKLKKEKSKESEEILSSINHAERLAKEYELKKKDGILTIDSPFEEIISMYKKAKLDFNRIGWIEEAIQLDNSLNYYKEKSTADKNLRALEKQKATKQEKEIKKQKIEKKLAKEAEEELLKLKTQALESKKRSVKEYESKKDQAFNFMDLAKKELKQNNFERTVNYYKEAEKIFAEINWSEGIRMIKESINVIKIKKNKIEREAKLSEAKKREKLKLEAQYQKKIIKAKELQDIQQEQRKKELQIIHEEKEREREISEKAFDLLEEGTKQKDKKKFEEAYEKYILGRDMFKKIGWEHEVSRINNDLLILLKKEMKYSEKLILIQQKKVEEKKELEELLKDADEKQKELDEKKKQEKRKQRGRLIQKERDNADDIINKLKYNEGVLALRKIIKKIENTDQNKIIKELNKKIEVLENASQVPIITIADPDKDENRDKFKLAYQALDKAQISLSTNSYLRAITELNEALYNLRGTQLGFRFIAEIEDRVNTYKKELDIKKAPEQKREAPKIENDDIRVRIAARRAERRKKIKDLMDR